MALLPLECRHWAYVWIPIVASFVWFGMLWAMLIVWLASGRPKYVSQDGSIAFISDVGASYLKPLFISGCAVTAAGFFLSLVIERYLRHSGRLLPHMRRRERVLSTLAVLGSFIGGLGLILLSVFDTKRFPRPHRIFLLVFIVGVAMSAIFTVMEYRWISKDFKFATELRSAYIAKAVIALVLILLSIAFAVALFKADDAGAVLEWLIAFLFTAYLFSYFFDLRQSKGKRKGELKAQPMMAEHMNGTDNGQIVGPTLQ